MDRGIIELLQSIFCFLSRVRDILVEAFENLKDRRLREVYDVFSMMMLHFDKLHQFLRRISKVNEDSCTERDVNVMYAPEIAVMLRQLQNIALALNDYAKGASPQSIIQIIYTMDSLVNDLASMIEKLLRQV